MKIILITAHLPRLIAQSKFRNGLPVYNGLIFYYFNDNFVQYTVLDFQKKILGPAGPQVFIFGRQNKYFSHQKLYLRTNGIQ